MNNTRRLIIPLMLLCLCFAIWADDKIIVINNTPVNVDEVDSITFDVSVTPPVQKVWNGRDVDITPISEGTTNPFFSDLKVDSVIYHITDCDSDLWKEMWITPVGYFYRADYADILALNENADTADIYNDASLANKTFWAYESFDSQKWAEFIVQDSITVQEIEYNDGYVGINTTPETVDIEHAYGDSFKEDERPNSFSISPYEWVNNDALLNLMWTETEIFESRIYTYQYSEGEEGLRNLQSTLRSLFNFNRVETISAATAPAANETAKKAATRKKKKYRSASFGIVPVTYNVNGVYDNSVEYLRGAIKCASYRYIREFEYGILIAKDPSKLTVDSAEFKVPARQEKLKSNFASYVDWLASDTKYYYRTYAVIPKSELGNYHFKYGDRRRTQGYGKIKTFTTMKGYGARLDISSPFSIFNGSFSLVLSHFRHGYYEDNTINIYYDTTLLPKAGWSYIDYASPIPTLTNNNAPPFKTICNTHHLGFLNLENTYEVGCCTGYCHVNYLTESDVRHFTDPNISACWITGNNGFYFRFRPNEIGIWHKAYLYGMCYSQGADIGSVCVTYENGTETISGDNSTLNYCTDFISARETKVRIVFTGENIAPPTEQQAASNVVENQTETIRSYGSQPETEPCGFHIGD